MRYTVPEDIGSELRLLEGVATAAIEKLIYGKSSTGNPKLTVKYIITEDMDTIPDGDPSAIGDTVLETYSLQPQAMWKLNDIYKLCVGERIPQGDFSQEEFEQMLGEALIGKTFSLVLQLSTDQNGKERTDVTDKAFIE